MQHAEVIVARQFGRWQPCRQCFQINSNRIIHSNSGLLARPGFICIYRIYRIYRLWWWWWWWYKLIININIRLLICNTHFKGQCSTHIIYYTRAYKSYKCIEIRALFTSQRSFIWQCVECIDDCHWR